MKKYIILLFFLFPLSCWADWGDTWDVVNTNTGSYNGMACNYDGSVCVAAISNGYIYNSTDSGSTWTQRDGTRAWNYIAGSSNLDLIVAGVYPNGFIYTSTDSGSTWTAKSGTGNWRAIACSDDGYMCVANDSTSQKIYRSVDRGETWDIANGFTGTVLEISCTGDGMVCYTGQVGPPYELYISTDYGLNWASNGYLIDYPRLNYMTKDSIHFMAGKGSSTGSYLYASSGGITWTQSTSSGYLWTFGTCSYNTEVCIAGTNGGGLFRSYTPSPSPPTPMDTFFTSEGLYEFATIEVWITMMVGIYAFMVILLIEKFPGKK